MRLARHPTSSVERAPVKYVLIEFRLRRSVATAAAAAAAARRHALQIHPGLYTVEYGLCGGKSRIGYLDAAPSPSHSSWIHHDQLQILSSSCVITQH